MARSLPLSGASGDVNALAAAPQAAELEAAELEAAELEAAEPEAPDDRDLAVPLTGTVQVFDPAMCCPTGVCGPGVDPALLAVARDLRWLTAQGVSVARFGLTHEPAEFVGNPRVAGLMQAFGDAALPAVLVNGLVHWYGRYPTRDELVEGLRQAAAEGTDGADVWCGSDGGTPADGCC